MEANSFSFPKKTAQRANRFLMGLGLLLLLACAGSKNTDNPQSFEQLNELVSSREFEIEPDWVGPSWGGRIDLNGTDFIRFEKDSVHVSLPYFGERYSGGGYGNDTGIEFEGPIKNLEIIRKKEKREIILRFEGEQGMEILEFAISIFANGTTSTWVTSSQRAQISYRGNIEALEE